MLINEIIEKNSINNVVLKNGTRVQLALTEQRNSAHLVLEAGRTRSKGQSSVSDVAGLIENQLRLGSFDKSVYLSCNDQYLIKNRVYEKYIIPRISQYLGPDWQMESTSRHSGPIVVWNNMDNPQVLSEGNLLHSEKPPNLLEYEVYAQSNSEWIAEIVLKTRTHGREVLATASMEKQKVKVPNTEISNPIEVDILLHGFSEVVYMKKADNFNDMGKKENENETEQSQDDGTKNGVSKSKIILTAGTFINKYLKEFVGSNTAVKINFEKPKVSDPQGAKLYLGFVQNFKKNVLPNLSNDWVMSEDDKQTQVSYTWKRRAAYSSSDENSG